MSRRKPYNQDSLRRALDHHVGRGAVVQYLIESESARSSAWVVTLPKLDPVNLTEAQVYGLVLGLRASELAATVIEVEKGERVTVRTTNGGILSGTLNATWRNGDDVFVSPDAFNGDTAGYSVVIEAGRVQSVDPIIDNDNITTNPKENN